jgi:hypothetical protein
MLNLLPNINSNNVNQSNNLLDNLSSFSKYSIGLFFLFTIILTCILFFYPGGFFNDKATSTYGIIIILFISILWIILIVANTFPEIINNQFTTGVTTGNSDNNLLKRALLMLFGIVISCIILAWVVYNLHEINDKTNITGVILNIILILIVLTFIYNTIKVEIPNKNINNNKNNFFNKIKNVLLSIYNLNILKILIKDYHYHSVYYIILLFSLLFLVLYFYLIPMVGQSFFSQGGKQLVNNPIYTDSQYILANYGQLNGNDNINYKFAISCWLFIDATPNANPTYAEYTSLLNFGNKPNIMYNGKTNTLMIIINQEKIKNNESFIDFDDNNNRIIYKNNNFPLQKWNHVIVNYNGGVLDVFLNGELVKSVIGVIPYHTLDNLTVGEMKGIKGGICNVVYFNKDLTITNIYYLYHFMKNRNPPVIETNNATIISI